MHLRATLGVPSSSLKQDPDVALAAALGDGGDTAAVVPVYGRCELGSLSVRSLRELCANLGDGGGGLDISHCVEKSEIVNAVAESGLARLPV